MSAGQVTCEGSDDWRLLCDLIHSQGSVRCGLPWCDNQRLESSGWRSAGGTYRSVLNTSLSRIEACFEYKPDVQDTLSAHKPCFSVHTHRNTWFE